MGCAVGPGVVEGLVLVKGDVLESELGLGELEEGPDEEEEAPAGERLEKLEV